MKETNAAEEAPKSEVTINDWEGKNDQDFKRVAEEILLPAVKTNVALHVPHGNARSPIYDGDFHIFFWSSPRGSNSIPPPSTIWETKVDCPDKSFLPSGRGVAICDNATGYAVAELVDNNLYIHHDLCHCGTPKELKIFGRLLTEVIQLIKIDKRNPEEKALYLAKMKEEMRKRSREAYTSLLSKRKELSQASAQETIEENKSRIKNLRAELIQLIRQVSEAKRALAGSTAVSSADLLRYGQEYDKLLASPKVLDVRVADEQVNIFTDILYCRNPKTGRTHEIGKFNIEIKADEGIRWFNLTRQVEEKNAPHIDSDGDACLGNAEEIVPELLANYEFAALAMIAIQFVESVNTGDSYVDIKNWPVVQVKERRKNEKRAKKKKSGAK
jgi:hypothetical protein